MGGSKLRRKFDPHPLPHSLHSWRVGLSQCERLYPEETRLSPAFHPNPPAVHSNLASRTKWAYRFAEILPVRDEEIIEYDPVARREFLSQSHLGIVGRLCFNVTQAI